MGNYINFEEKILVAGATGMAGRSICAELKNAGYGNKKNRGKIYTPTKSELNYLNFEETNLWFVNNKPTVVVVAAAKVGGIYANNNYSADFLLENIKIQTNLIECAWRNNVKRLLFLGSSCIYPKFSEQPIDEEELLTSALEPTNEAYAIAKITGIKLCETLRKQYKFDAISLMPTNLYGPGDNYKDDESHVMAALLKRFYEAVRDKKKEVVCWGTGSPYREFMHSKDLGKAVVFALEKWNPDDKNSPRKNNGEILTYLNVGTGIDLTIKELANKISKISGFDGKILWDQSKPDGTPKKQLNINRILKLGWSPEICINEGIEMVFKDIREDIT